MTQKARPGYKTVRLRTEVYNRLKAWSEANLGYRESLSDAVNRLVIEWRKP